MKRPTPSSEKCWRLLRNRQMTVCPSRCRSVNGGEKDTPPHFDRLRWSGVSGAVEAKCGGCERSLLFRRKWQGGVAGTAGASSQEISGVLSAPPHCLTEESYLEKKN